MADTFDSILREAMDHFKTRGFTSAEDLDEWMRKLEMAMRAERRSAQDNLDAYLDHVAVLIFSDKEVSRG